MATFKPNNGAIHNLLQGQTGPVFRHMQGFLAESQRLAKLHAPKDTGALAANTRAVGPHAMAGGLTGGLTAHAINPRTGRDYALAVHQGHKEIVPVSQPSLKFFWKKKGRFVVTQSVRARKGRPFLLQGLSEANATLGRGRFRITVTRPPRTEGS